MKSSVGTVDRQLGTIARWAVGALLAWSVVIALSAYVDTQGEIGQSMFFHGGMWLIGLIAGGLFFREQRRQLERLEQARIALRDSEARHSEAQRTAHLGHWSYDTNSEKFLWWSDETFRLLGLDVEAGHPDYRAFIERLHPADRDQVNAAVAQCLADGQPFVVQYRVPLADGGERHLEARGMAHVDAQGKVERMSGTVMDITQRRLAEQQLLKFQALAEASTDAFVMADPETTLLGYANKAAHDLFGCDYARREMIGRPGADFWPADDQETRRQVIGAGMTPGGWRGNVRQRRKDGSIFDASATVFAIGAEHRDPRCLVAIIRDISEQKLAEQALRTANEKLEAIVDFLPDATFVIDSDSRVIAWNRAMEEITGVVKADMLGKGDFAYAEALYGVRRPMLIDLVLADADRGRTLYKNFHQEGQTLYAEGETPEAYGGRGAYVWATALPLTDSTGRQVGAVECLRDITASRRAEQALQLGEERLRLALEGTADGIWDWDLVSGQAYFSPRYYTMLGYQPDEFPATYENWRGLVHPDDLAAAEAAVQAHIDGVGDNYAAEFRCRCKDGGWRWILGRGKVVRWDESGRATRLAGSHSDIADRKEIEHRLRLTQFAVDNASDAVFWFDRDGHFSYTNNRASQLLGYTGDELIRMSIPDVDINLSRPDIRPLTEKLAAEGELTLETELRRKDGRIMPVEISAKHIDFAGTEHMAAHVRDVSERKRAESALRAEKQFSDAVINSLPGLFYLIDDHAQLVRWNDNFARVTGHAPAALKGMPASNFVAEDDRPLLAERMAEVMRDGASSIEARLLTAGGDAIPHYFTGLRMRDGNRDYLVGTAIDISPLRLAESALRLTRFAMERSADAIYLIGPDSRFLDVNEAACAALGYDRDTLLTMAISDIDPSAPADLLASMFDDLRRLGRNRLVTSHRRRDGSMFPVEVMANYLQFDGNEYNWCFVRDISERRRAEAALHLTRRAIDDAAMAFEWYDHQGRIIDVNRRSCVDLGYSREELVGLSLWDIDPEYSAERWPETWAMIKGGGSIAVETVHRRKGGDSFPVLVTGNYVEFEGHEYVFSYAQDITTRRQAESMLRLTQQAVDASSIAFQWLDREGRVVSGNPRAYESLGFTREEFIGLRIWDFDPDFTPENLEQIWSAMRRGPVRVETRHRRKDGSIFPVEITTNIVEFEGKDYSFAYVMDITERKAAENALRDLNATLEARVQDEVAKNREKDHLLIQQSRLAAMGEMIGNIAHQWRQPINALSLVLANVKDAFDYGELDRAYLGNQVARGDQLIQKMSSTIDDFRNFFRPDRSRQRFSLAKAVRDATTIVEASYSQAKIALVLEIEPDAECLGFANEYAQVMLNLLANAKDAIVERQVANGRVVIRIDRADRQALLTVTDNGGGIPPDVLHKVFDPYFTTRDKGTGIGLYMSRMIIENMAGRIDVTNIDHGTRVVVALPLDNAATDTPET